VWAVRNEQRNEVLNKKTESERQDEVEAIIDEIYDQKKLMMEGDEKLIHWKRDWWDDKTLKSKENWIKYIVQAQDASIRARNNSAE